MGGPLIEQLQREGLPVYPFDTNNTSKAQAVEALALAFERGTIRIPNDAVLIGELQAFESKPLPSGMMRYEAPSGGHDDIVMALAIAFYSLGVAKEAQAAESRRVYYDWRTGELTEEMPERMQISPY